MYGKSIRNDGNKRNIAAISQLVTLEMVLIKSSVVLLAPDSEIFYYPIRNPLNIISFSPKFSFISHFTIFLTILNQSTNFMTAAKSDNMTKASTLQQHTPTTVNQRIWMGLSNGSYRSHTTVQSGMKEEISAAPL